MRLFPAAILVSLLCAMSTNVGCGGTPSNKTTTSGTSVAGNWEVTAPASDGLFLMESGTSLTGLWGPATNCGLTMLQGTVTGNQVTLTGGSGALTINATASASTLSGTLICGLTSGPFAATLIDISGQWTGTFLSTQNTGFANTIGAKANVTLNITQNPQLNYFPTPVGTATFTTTGTTSPFTCLVPLDNQGAGIATDPVYGGSIQGTTVTFTVTNNLFGPPQGDQVVPPNWLLINGTIAGGNMTLSYRTPCYPWVTAPSDYEMGTGTLTKQ